MTYTRLGGGRAGACRAIYGCLSALASGRPLLSDERLWNCVVVEHSTVFSSIPTSSVQYHKHSTVFSSIPTSIVQYHKHSTVFTVFTVLHYSRLSAALIVTDLNLVCITLLHYYLSTILK